MSCEWGMNRKSLCLHAECLIFGIQKVLWGWPPINGDDFTQRVHKEQRRQEYVSYVFFAWNFLCSFAGNSFLKCHWQFISASPGIHAHTFQEIPKRVRDDERPKPSCWNYFSIPWTSCSHYPGDPETSSGWRTLIQTSKLFLSFSKLTAWNLFIEIG